jgi:DNA-binding response OmpR family regulator
VVRAILRRRELDAHEAHPTRDVGGLHLDLERSEASVEGEPVQLTQSELKLLALLSRDPGRVYSRQEIMQAPLARATTSATRGRPTCTSRTSAARS